MEPVARSAFRHAWPMIPSLPPFQLDPTSLLAREDRSKDRRGNHWKCTDLSQRRCRTNTARGGKRTTRWEIIIEERELKPVSPYRWTQPWKPLIENMDQDWERTRRRTGDWGATCTCPWSAQHLRSSWLPQDANSTQHRISNNKHFENSKSINLMGQD